MMSSAYTNNLLVKGVWMLLSLLLIKPVIAQQKVINLSDYGVVPNSYKNAVVPLNKAIQDAGKGNCILRFPGGRIDIWPEGAPQRTYHISNASEPDEKSLVKTIGMVFNQMNNITIEGNNTLLVYHGKMMLMAIDGCKQFKVQNLSFDFQRPTVSEMTIISKTANTVTAKINPDCWYSIEKDEDKDHPKLVWFGEGWKTEHFFVAVFSPKTQRMTYGNWQDFENSTAKTNN